MSESVMCNAINPDNGDQCECFLGHGGSHRATRMWDTPYRMAEPKNVGAVVIGAWFDNLFARFDRELNPWVSLRTGCVYEWVDIPDPQPYQNCVLTADDPEPPEGSLVRSQDDVVCEHDGSGWRKFAAASFGARWPWDSVAVNSVTLLYRGEA